MNDDAIWISMHSSFKLVYLFIYEIVLQKLAHPAVSKI